jgi:hypothetical protein
MFVFERKSWADLAASIKDGRKDNIQKMLKLRDQIGCKLFMLIEGPARFSPTHKIGRIPYKNLQAYLDHIVVRDGIFIIYSKSYTDTPLRLLEFIKNYLSLDAKKTKNISSKVMPDRPVLVRQNAIDGWASEDLDAPNKSDLSDQSDQSNQSNAEAKSGEDDPDLSNLSIFEPGPGACLLGGIEEVDPDAPDFEPRPDVYLLSGKLDIHRSGGGASGAHPHLDLLTQVTQKTDIQIIYSILCCLPMVSEKTAAVLYDNQVHISDIVLGRIAVNELASLRYPNGTLIGKKAGKIAFKSAAGAARAARAADGQAVFRRMLACIRGISTKSAAAIAEQLSMRDLMTGAVSLSELAAIKKTEKATIGPKAAAEIIKYFVKVTAIAAPTIAPPQ